MASPLLVVPMIRLHFIVAGANTKKKNTMGGAKLEPRGVFSNT